MVPATCAKMTDAEIEASFAAAAEAGRKLYEEKQERQKKSEHALHEFVRKVYDLPEVTREIRETASRNDRYAIVYIDDILGLPLRKEFKNVEDNTTIQFGDFVVRAMNDGQAGLSICLN
jgi:hypothetical protein